MLQNDTNNLLDFLAEDALEKGAAVTFRTICEIPAIEVFNQNYVTSFYLSAKELVSKMSFLRGNNYKELLVPVLRTEEEMTLTAALLKNGIDNVRVYRLPITKRFAWYSRSFVLNRKEKSASAKSFPGM